MSEKIHVPDALGMLEKALDDLTGSTGAGAAVSREASREGALGKFVALAKAISGAASGGGLRHGTTVPAWARPATQPPPHAAKEPSELEQYEALQGTPGKSSEAGEYYLANAPQILQQLHKRQRGAREDLRRERGY